jgi:hypothetical protein
MAKLNIRKDRTSIVLHKLAKSEPDARISRRLLGIANALDGMSRAEAAKCAGMDRQTLRDWVVTLLLPPWQSRGISIGLSSPVLDYAGASREAWYADRCRRSRYHPPLQVRLDLFSTCFVSTGDSPALPMMAFSSVQPRSGGILHPRIGCPNSAWRAWAPLARAARQAPRRGEEGLRSGSARRATAYRNHRTSARKSAATWLASGMCRSMVARMSADTPQPWCSWCAIPVILWTG